MANAPILDRKFLERLERLTIHWQKSFPGLVGGHNKSRLPGGGQEFLDHRHFHQGDDLRAVNWRAYMRLDKMFLKLFQVEPRVPVRMLLDISESMAPGGAAGSSEKFDFARKLAGALCYVGLVRLDTIEVLPFAGKLQEGKVCGGGRHLFTPLSRFLEGLKPGGSTSFLKVVREFLNDYPQRGLVIVISDFLDDNGCERALQYLTDFGHELLLIQIWAEEDRTPPWTGELELCDAETSAGLKLDFDDSARQRYTEAFDEYCDAIQTMALRSGGRYAGFSTAASLESIVFGELIRVKGIA